MVRPILNKWHPSTKKLTYWFPLLFSLGLVLAILFYIIGYKWVLLAYGVYFLIAFLFALVSTKNLVVSVLAIPAILIQFFGYGYGFLKSTLAVSVLNKNPETYFPKLFFRLN
jgi:hypothetical protein